MAFKGTARRSALQIAEEIEDVGGYINAYTSREQTAYYARVLKDDIPLALDLIADIVLNPAFDAREIEVERGGTRIRLSRASAAVPVAATVMPLYSNYDRFPPLYKVDLEHLTKAASGAPRADASSPEPEPKGPALEAAPPSEPEAAPEAPAAAKAKVVVVAAVVAGFFFGILGSL